MSPHSIGVKVVECRSLILMEIYVGGRSISGRRDIGTGTCIPVA